MLASLVLSTIAFFVARHYIKGFAARMDFPKGTMLSISIFVAAVAVSYGVGFVADLIFH